MRAGLAGFGILMLIAAFLPVTYVSGKTRPGESMISILQDIWNHIAVQDEIGSALFVGVCIVAFLAFGVLSVANGLAPRDKRRMRAQRMLMYPTLGILIAFAAILVFMFYLEDDKAHFWDFITGVTSFWTLLLPVSFLGARYFFLRVSEGKAYRKWKHDWEKQQRKARKKKRKKVEG